jgi:hypothetical protein
MSSSQSVPRKAMRWLAYLPRLRMVVGIALVLAAVGFGVHSAMNRRIEMIDDSELKVLDDLVGGDNAEASMGQPRRLTSATITDVVPAVHEEDSGERHGVQMAAHTIGVRPESQPPVWLSGTIEDTDTDSVRGDQHPSASSFRRFNR